MSWSCLKEKSFAFSLRALHLYINLFLCIYLLSLTPFIKFFLMYISPVIDSIHKTIISTRTSTNRCIYLYRLLLFIRIYTFLFLFPDSPLAEQTATAPKFREISHKRSTDRRTTATGKAINKRSNRIWSIKCCNMSFMSTIGSHGN